MDPEEKKVWGEFSGWQKKEYFDYIQKAIATKKAGKPEQGWDILWSDAYEKSKAHRSWTDSIKKKLSRSPTGKRRADSNAATAGYRHHTNGDFPGRRCARGYWCWYFG